MVLNLERRPEFGIKCFVLQNNDVCKGGKGHCLKNQSCCFKKKKGMGERAPLLLPAAPGSGVLITVHTRNFPMALMVL